MAAALALGLISATVIGLQLVIMQLLSVAQWHHFAWMVISVALLGFGAAGTVLALWRRPLLAAAPRLVPVLYALAGMAAAAVPLLTGGAAGFDAFLLFQHPDQLGRLALTCLGYCLPFFLAGLAITVLFCARVGGIGGLYAANLGGSAAGAVFIVLLADHLPVPALAGVLAGLAAVAALLVAPRRPRARSVDVLILATAVAALLSAWQPVAPQPSQYKAIRAALQLPGARVTHSRWSAQGLLQVVQADALRFAPSLSLRFMQAPPVREVAFMNGEGIGTLLGRGEAGGAHLLDWSTRGLPWAVRKPARVLVLAAGTGEDVSQAVYHGAARVDAVEDRQALLALLQTQEPERIDGLYREAAVTVHRTTPRAFLASPGPRWDLIVLPPLGAFGGTAGTHALQEAYMLTREAFAAMLARLDERGMIATTVWHGEPPRRLLRLLATWRELLAAQGVADPAAHILAVRSWGTTTLILSRTPFAPAAQARLRAFAEARGFDPLLPAGPDRQRYNRVADTDLFEAVDALVAGRADALLAGYDFNVRPTRDDRPFFEHFLRWDRLASVAAHFGLARLPYLEIGFVTAVVTCAVVSLAALLLIVLPLTRLGWQGRRRGATLAYFTATGTAYLCVEIVLIHKLVLWLGEPVHATAVVLGGMLAFSGLGSAATARLPASRASLTRAALLAAVMVLLTPLAMQPLTAAMAPWSMPLKVLVSLAVIAPAAIAMGLLFPLGLRRLASADEGQLPWACAIDACLSVLAAALATLIAMDAGFGVMLAIAATAYLSAAASGRALAAD